MQNYVGVTWIQDDFSPDSMNTTSLRDPPFQTREIPLESLLWVSTIAMERYDMIQCVPMTLFVSSFNLEDFFFKQQDLGPETKQTPAHKKNNTSNFNLNVTF